MTCISLPTCCPSALGCSCHPIRKSQGPLYSHQDWTRSGFPSWPITRSLLAIPTFSILDPPLRLAQPPLNAMLWAIPSILLLPSCTVSFSCTWHVMAAGQPTLLIYPAWLLEPSTLILRVLSNLPRHRTQMPPSQTFPWFQVRT